VEAAVPLHQCGKVTTIGIANLRISEKQQLVMATEQAMTRAWETIQ